MKSIFASIVFIFPGLDPRMVKQCRDARALLGVLLQALTDEVDSMGRAFSKCLELEGGFFLKDRFDQALLIFGFEGQSLA